MRNFLYCKQSTYVWIKINVYPSKKLDIYNNGEEYDDQREKNQSCLTSLRVMTIQWIDIDDWCNFTR